MGTIGLKPIFPSGCGFKTLETQSQNVTLRSYLGRCGLID